MNVVRQIEEYLDALANARHALRSPSVAVPFVAFGLLQGILLVLFAFFATPPIAAFMIPVVSALGGEAALHYPTHFVLLPAMYQRVYLPLVATLGFALWSYGVWSMVAHHEASERVPRHSFRSAWPSVVTVGVVFVVVTVAVGRGLSALAANAPPGIPARAGTIAGIALTACLQAFMLFAPVVLRLRGGGPLAALRTSARYAWSHFGASALLVATVLLVHAPLDALIGNADALAARFRPEAVFQLMVGSVLLEVATAFVLFAGAVALALPEEGGMR